MSQNIIRFFLGDRSLQVKSGLSQWQPRIGPKLISFREEGGGPGSGFVLP